MLFDSNERADFLSQLSEFEPEIFLDEPLLKRNPSSKNSNVSLIDLERKAKECKLCGLSETRTNVVFADGDSKARVMFIGEGPGADEDQQGKPFVGRAGQLLNKIIVAMKLTRETVYIANVVKCRPPENRDPLPEEADLCTPYLREQIRLVNPEIMIALGKVAAVHLLGVSPTVSVKSLRNQIHKYENHPLIVTYHPAALLRSAKYKAPTWKDMQVVMKILDNNKEG